MTAPPDGLQADLVVCRGDHRLEARLSVAPGEVVAVVGPNGAGKSTLLDVLAGVVPVDEGQVTVGGRVWDGPGVRLQVKDRHVGIVFQDNRLFPHLSLLDNVGFGPRMRGLSRRAARERAAEWLDRLGVGALADRRPGEVSGGQAQRAAIARALAADPVVLLLDEPFAALDVGVAMELRLELARHLADFAGMTLLVTHDALDALTLADRVVVLDEGRVAQEGTPREVTARPRSPHVARLVGLNVLSGVSRGSTVALPGGVELVTAEPYDGPVYVTFSPAAVTLSAEEPTGSARNRWRCRVVSAMPHGLAVRVQLDVGGGVVADLTAESAARLGVTPGASVWATVKATELEVRAALDPFTVAAPPIP